ncbi:MAG: SGNH/GDSL hydrolase family protein [Gordonia sp. (in: high G+C Gram-positive bacteria)]
MEFSRFVAIGDSQTEGMGDVQVDGVYRGWADRLAEQLAATVSPGLQYANLAIRGKNTRAALREQLNPALALNPDLIAAPLGMNDVIGRADFEQLRDDFAVVYGRLAETGATVLVSTFPDVTSTIPFGATLRSRLLALNELVVEVAERYGFVLVDLYSAPVLTDLRSWSVDRLHASPVGHQRFAAGAAHALGLPGSDPQWGRPLSPLPAVGRSAAAYRDARWAVEFFIPWFVRHVRGVSLGDGLSPKRPALTPVRGQESPADQGVDPAAFG